MSKKRRLKKRIARSKKSYSPDSSFKDKHHILFQRKSWSGGYKGELRRYWYCGAFIPKNTLHHYIHEELSRVPVPRESSCKEVLYHLRLLNKQGVIHEEDSIQKKLRVLIALFDCIEQPTADALRKQLEIVDRYYKPS